MITYHLQADLTNERLNALFNVAWPEHRERDFVSHRSHWLTDVTARDGDRLVGFAYLAWDGGVHAFLLDPTVHPDYRRQGIGSQLIGTLVEEARCQGIEWIHVDFEPHLRSFYAACGFRPTEAGLVHLVGPD